MNEHAVSFARFAADALSGGCSVRAALDALAEHAPTRRVRESAKSVLALVERGFTLPEACLEQRIFRDVLWRRLLGESERTGKVQLAFELALSLVELKSTLRSSLAGALPYPATLLGLLLAGTTWLLASGLPKLNASGLYKGEAAAASMEKGALIALLFLLAASAAAAAAFTLRASNLARREGFWTTLENLSLSGIGFEDCMAFASAEWARGGRNHGEDRSGRGMAGSEFFGIYERTVLQGAFETGEYERSFAVLAARQRTKTKQGFAALEKLIEPAVTAIAGIAILILSATVFLPLAVQGGTLQ